MRLKTPPISFAYKITGTLTNNTDKEKSYIQIEYVLYDGRWAIQVERLLQTPSI